MSAERLRGLVEAWRMNDKYETDHMTWLTCADELEQAIGEMVDDAAVERALSAFRDTPKHASGDYVDYHSAMKAALLAALGEKP